MIAMVTFNQIIQLRNKGITQREIAERLGISRASVCRYLKSGKIPKYKRSTNSNKADPLEPFYEDIKNKLENGPHIALQDLYEYLLEKGYKGSDRTLRRKTAQFRQEIKRKEVYFQRLTTPGEIMEGDFTELNLEIGGKIRKIYIWVTSLPYSNTYFATGYYHCSFECFADGSINAFNEFGGIAKRYRLDNMSPVVTKILLGKEREITSRYRDFQDHYNFMQDFCNPGKGNEKGNVEANNKHLKRKIRSLIELNKLTFKDLNSFNVFLHNICRKHNSFEKVKDRMNEENLLPLPAQSFKSFRTEVVSISKYSLFSIGSAGHMYSVPSRFIGLSLEARIYPEKIEVMYNGEVIAKHIRLYGLKGLVSINVEHIILGLAKKPHAMKDWKYKKILFERPVWKRFYEKLKNNDDQDKNYLKCLALIDTYGKDLVSCAMELAIEDDLKASSETLLEILSNKKDSILTIRPIETNLLHYDELITRGNN